MKDVSYLLIIFFLALAFTMCSDDEKGETVEMMDTRDFVLPEGNQWQSGLNDRGLYVIDSMEDWTEIAVAEEGVSTLPDVDFENETLLLVVVKAPMTGYETDYGLYKFGGKICLVDVKLKDSDTQIATPSVVVISFVSKTKIAKGMTYNTYFTLPFN